MVTPSSGHPVLSAKSFFHGRVSVESNDVLARDTYRLRLGAPGLSRAIRPGQFVMVRLTASTDPLLGRPFALYDTVVNNDSQVTGLDVVYLVVGKQTALLAKLRAGDQVDIWGPLGNGLPELNGLDHVALVAGGIGQTPFLAYARELLGQRGYAGRPARRMARQVSLFYGVRTADLAAGLQDFRDAGAIVHLASDDGSLGYHGFVTQLLEKQSPPQHLVGCGPEAMMKALAGLARRWSVPCHVSLETPMACGIGVCFSCVAPIRAGDGWDYRRACVDGPVFDSTSLAWD
jgi:dihydroorotate dehydrogenase electron transfer subunit